jgi:TIR domain
MANSSVYVSYNWGPEGDDPIVTKLEAACKARGIELQRDIRKLKYGGSIKGFMDTLGAADHVVVVLRDGYLKSPNCMYELREIARNGSFQERVNPVEPS